MGIRESRLRPALVLKHLSQFSVDAPTNAWIATDVRGRIWNKKKPFSFFSKLWIVTDVLKHTNGAKAGIAHND